MNETATTMNPPRFVAETAPVDPSTDLLGLVAAAGFDESLFYMEKPDEGEAMLAIGARATVRSSGSDRFGIAANETSALWAGVDARSGAGWPSGGPMPRLVGGFGFADECRSTAWRDFAPCVFVLPREQWIRERGRAVRIEIGGTPAGRDETSVMASRTALGVAYGGSENGRHGVGGESRAEWLARARAAIAEVEEGRLGKIVLARRETHAIVDELDVVGVLARLRATRPSCHTFCFAFGGSIFLGSSPEKFVAIRGGCFEADALAGTAARGESDDDDRRCGLALLESAKDRCEHELVVEAIRAALSPLATAVAVDQEPSVRKYPEGFHLRTGVRGTLAAGATVFDVITALHPTPAVCGVPRARARELLERIETDRGWYSGGVGWLAADGDASFAVALRAGLWQPGRLSTWAGAGIVKGSDAERELAEVELKMRALLNVVEATADAR
jgi:salicylate biosynthesis isochorismate synthase